MASDVECLRMLKQKAVLWPFTGYDENGDPEFGTAVEIKCRWEQGIRESIKQDGSPIGTSDSVFVDRDILVDSKLWKGALADLPDPIPNGEDKVVVDFIKVPDGKARKYTRTVSLQKI